MRVMNPLASTGITSGNDGAVKAFDVIIDGAALTDQPCYAWCASRRV
jgi:hypothetical protein